VGVSAVALAVVVQPPPTRHVEIQLTAQGQPLPQPSDYFSNLLTPRSNLLAPRSDLLAHRQQEVAGAPNFAAALPAPPISAPVPATESIGEAIKAIYDTVEPWVAYGWELFEWTAGWVVGVLAQQIGIVYDFWETITQSVVFNFADLLDAQVTFLQGLANIGTATFDAFVQLGVNEFNWLRSLFPPLPPVPFAAQQQQATTVATDSPREPDDTLTARATTAAADLAKEATSLTTDAEPTDTEPTDPTTDAEPTTDVAPQLSDIDTALASGDKTLSEAVLDAADTDAEKIVRAQGEVRGAVAEAVNDVAGATGPETIVRAQGEVRGAVGEAVNDVDGADKGEPKAVRHGAADVPSKFTTVARNGVRQLTEAVEKVSDDLRSAVRGPGSDSNSVSAG